MQLKFEDIKFNQKEDFVRANFLKIFYFDIKNEELEKIGKFKVKDEILTINCSEKKSHKFDHLLLKGFNELTNILNGKKTVYIHKNSEIPLMGNVAFGIIDRNTNIIEIKPITSCNLDCIYCSVSELKRPVDFIVEADYMVEELNKLIEFKENNNIEIHIGCQGEPLRYKKLAYLVKEIRKNKSVKRVSMDTNGTLLTEKIIDEFIESGFTRLNISLNSVDKKNAKQIAVKPYNLEHVLNMIKYVAKSKVELIVAPVWAPGINDNDIEEIVNFVAKLKNKQTHPKVGIQKYLRYKGGRLLKELSWEDFFSKLKELQDKYGLKLIFDETDFDIEKTKNLPKPFKKGEIIEAKIISEGRLKNEKLLVAKNRTISIINSFSKGIIKVKIKRTKHNIFTAELIN